MVKVSKGKTVGIHKYYGLRKSRAGWMTKAVKVKYVFRHEIPVYGCTFTGNSGEIIKYSVSGEIGTGELNLGRDGVTGKFGSGGVDVSGALLDVARWGTELAKQMMKQETPQHWLPDELRGQIPEELFNQLRDMKEKPDWMTGDMWKALELFYEYVNGEIDFAKFGYNADKPYQDDIIKAAEAVGFDKSVINILKNDPLMQFIINNAGAMGLPDGNIFIPNSYTGNEKIAIIVHELAHLAQYSGGDSKAVFEKLIVEAIQYTIFKDTNNSINVSSALESWAKRVDPTFNPTEKINPYYNQSTPDRWFYENMAQNKQDNAWDHLIFRKPLNWPHILFGY